MPGLSLEKQVHDRPTNGAARLARMCLEDISTPDITYQAQLSIAGLRQEFYPEHPLHQTLGELRWNKVAAMVDEQNALRPGEGQFPISERPFLLKEMELCAACGNVLRWAEGIDRVAIEYGFSSRYGEVRIIHHKTPCVCERPGALRPPRRSAQQQVHTHSPNQHVSTRMDFYWCQTHRLQSVSQPAESVPNTGGLDSPDVSVFRLWIEPDVHKAVCSFPGCQAHTFPLADDSGFARREQDMHSRIFRDLGGRDNTYILRNPLTYTGMREIETADLAADVEEAVRRLNMDVEMDVCLDVVDEATTEEKVGPGAETDRVSKRLVRQFQLARAEKAVADHTGNFERRPRLGARMRSNSWPSGLEEPEPEWS